MGPHARLAERAGSWTELLEPPYALSAIVVVLCILAPAYSAFITATVLPSAIAEIGGLAIYAWGPTPHPVAPVPRSAGNSGARRNAGMRRTFLLAARGVVVGARA